jgi:histidine triad (HIT) family protein
MSYDPNCIFCKIVAGQIPCAKVYENHKYLAFLDISPVNPGHTLVIPKEHYENLLNTPDSVLDGMLNDAKKIAKAVLKAVGADSFNLGINVGKTSGQVVPHLHIHIMPRFANDGHHLFRQGSYKEGEMENIANKIRNNIE